MKLSELVDKLQHELVHAQARAADPEVHLIVMSAPELLLPRAPDGTYVLDAIVDLVLGPAERARTNPHSATPPAEIEIEIMGAVK